MDINQLEVDIQREINRIRANPSAVIPELQELVKNFKGKYYKIPNTNINIVTNEGADAVLDVIEWLKTVPVCAPLVEAKGLYSAARDHAIDLGEAGKTSHVGSDGSRMNERIERYGEWDHSLAENIAFDDSIARDIVIGMLIDDGNKSRGHRRNLINPDFKFMGVACSPHAKFRWVTVINFAVHFVDKSDLTVQSNPTGSIRKKTSIMQDIQTKDNGAINEGDGSRVSKINVMKGVSVSAAQPPAEQKVSAPSFGNGDQIPVIAEQEAAKDNGNQEAKRSLSPLIGGRNGPAFDEKVYDFENDPDRPQGSVSVKIKRHIKVKGNRRMIKLTKVYTMARGEPEIIEIIDFEST